MSEDAMMNPMYTYDFTLGCEFCDVETLKKLLSEHCKKWVFQKEQDEKTGYLHFQGRVSLKEKKRIKTLENSWPIKQTRGV